jgi:hypothetical protein
MTKKIVFNSIEELTEFVNKKTEETKLFQEILKEDSKYPWGILVRNKKHQAMAYKTYTNFLSKAKSILTEEYFSYLYKETAINNRPHGEGYMIPVLKSLDINSIILALRNLAVNEKLELRFDLSKDGPCEDGRNTITEWKLLPPDFTMENAIQFFSDFGVVKNVVRQREGFAVTFSQIFETLPLRFLISGKNIGSTWFSVFVNRSVSCRFTSSNSCSKCHLKGHHHSRCPSGLSEKVQQYKTLLIPKSDSHKGKAKNTRNLKDTFDSVEVAEIIDNYSDKLDNFSVEGVNIDTVVSTKNRKTKSKRSKSPSDSSKLQVTLPTNTSKSKANPKKNSKDPTSAKKPKKIDSGTSKKQNFSLFDSKLIIKDPELELFSKNFDNATMEDENEQETKIKKKK